MAVAAVALGPGVGFADPPAKPTEPDEEFLEFLGTVDSTADANTPADDQSWVEYLSKTDIDRAAQGQSAKNQGTKDQGTKNPSAPAQPPGANAPGPSGAKGPTAPAAQGTDTKPGAPKVKSDGQ